MSLKMCALAAQRSITATAWYYCNTMMWTVEAHFYVCHYDLYENQINNIMSYAQVKAHDKDEVEMKHANLWTKKHEWGLRCFL